MIYGYPWPPSVVQGGTLTLCIATDAAEFRVDFYRQADGLVFMMSSAWFPGVNVAMGDGASDWGWPPCVFAIPSEWPSGVYIAILRTGDGRGHTTNNPSTETADGLGERALFVVLSANSGSATSIVYKIPLMTYQAYNYAGGASLYRDPIPSVSPNGSKVSLRRIGGGIGADQVGDPVPDAYDGSSPRQVFAHWDGMFIRCLVRNRIPVDYCTDLDIHTDPGLLVPCHLLLSVGHDEYWSQAMRYNVANFIVYCGYFVGQWKLIRQRETARFVLTGVRLLEKVQFHDVYSSMSRMFITVFESRQSSNLPE